MTAGGGCWIQMDACAADPSIKLSFYDAAGEQSSGSGKFPPLNSKTFQYRYMYMILQKWLLMKLVYKSISFFICVFIL